MFDYHSVYLVLGLAFILGTVMGSFVTMASYRLPRGEDIVFKPSHCPHCKAVLKVRDLFPVLSWISTGGKCRYCHAAFGVHYLLIELSLGIAFTFIVLFYGLTFDTLIYLALVTELSILIVTDLEHTIIPDSIQVALFITGIVAGIYHNSDFGELILSASVGLILGLALRYGYLYMRKKDGLGWADVKFLAVAGIWLTLPSFIPFLFFAGLFGIITGLAWRLRSDEAIFPFGPALALSLFINVLFPDMLTKMAL